MKTRYLFLIIILTFISEIFITVYYLNKKTNYENDSVKINELVKSIEEKKEYETEYEYTILNEKEEVVKKTNNKVSDSLFKAYKNKDTIIDLNIDNKTYKLIINNDLDKIIEENKRTYFNIILVISCIQLLSFIIYYILSYVYLIKPFKKMKDFATRVSAGNLDIPLDMDRNNNFGAFTESFDIMRHEIKESRKKEKEAIEAKKELVAKLSHDIKSPVASIKSSSELGLELSKDKDLKKQFTSINQKSDQINTLVTNLFNSTLEEMEELTVNPTKINSSVIKELIDNSDYQNKAKNFTIEKCEVYADMLRLQQVFDNIFMNSYKYANTRIEVNSKIENDFLIISVKDFGESIKDDELPLLLEKFKRGSNTKNKDGVGLGLYISASFMNQMNGELDIENDHPGFKVIVKLRII